MEYENGYLTHDRSRFVCDVDNEVEVECGDMDMDRVGGYEEGLEMELPPIRGGSSHLHGYGNNTQGYGSYGSSIQGTGATSGTSGYGYGYGGDHMTMDRNSNSYNHSYSYNHSHSYDASAGVGGVSLNHVPLSASAIPLPPVDTVRPGNDTGHNHSHGSGSGCSRSHSPSHDEGCFVLDPMHGDVPGSSSHSQSVSYTSTPGIALKVGETTPNTPETPDSLYPSSSPVVVVDGTDTNADTNADNGIGPGLTGAVVGSPTGFVLSSLYPPLSVDVGDTHKSSHNHNHTRLCGIGGSSDTLEDMEIAALDS